MLVGTEAGPSPESDVAWRSDKRLGIGRADSWSQGKSLQRTGPMKIATSHRWPYSTDGQVALLAIPHGWQSELVWTMRTASGKPKSDVAWRSDKGLGGYTYGLYSYGLCNYGLYRYGLHSYGLYRYGLYRYGLCSDGLSWRSLGGCGGPTIQHRANYIVMADIDRVYIVMAYHGWGMRWADDSAQASGMSSAYIERALLVGAVVDDEPSNR